MARHAIGAIRLAGAVAAIAAIAIAQQRQPFFATVTGHDGKPVAEATVTCVFTPDAVNPWPRDVVVATSDARGRAKCNLQLGRLYTAWVVTAPDEHGEARVSDGVPLVAAGRVLELKVAELRRPHPVSLPGIDPWRDVGASGLRWFPDANHDVWLDLPLPAGPTVELPPSSSVTGCLALLDARGEVMVSSAVDPLAVQLPELPRPIAIDAMVRDEAGKPIVGASVRYGVLRRATWRRLFRSGQGADQLLPIAGTTDAGGRLRFHAPQPASVERSGRSRPGSLMVFASASGREHQTLAVSAAGTIDFVLRPATVTRLRLIGAPTHGIELTATGSFQVNMAGGSVYFGQEALEVRPAAASGWSVFSNNSGFVARLNPSSHPTMFVVDRISVAGGEQVINLDALAKVQVRVVDESGGPTPCALGVTSEAEGFPVLGFPMSWNAVGATDPAGLAELRLPGGEFYVYATTGSAHAAAAIDRSSSEPLVLRLKPLPTMQLHVLDADGKPVEGARAEGMESDGGGSAGEPLQRFWQQLGFQLWWPYVRLARSDVQGVMNVPAFVQGQAQRFEVRAACGSAMVTLKAGGSEDVVLRQ